MIKIDLNCDLGESFGTYALGQDEEIIGQISSVNVACGWHGGDPLVMEKTVKAAKKSGVAVGAHPGFNDLMGFGRRNMSISAEEAKAYIKYQIGALMAFLKSEDMKMQHVKPHGALYNMASSNYELAEAICEGVYEVDKGIIILAPSNSKLQVAAQNVGLKFAGEVFADRAYTDLGELVPRRQEGAVITEIESMVLRTIKMIKYGRVTSINGMEIDMKADSVCVHGDNPNALRVIERMKREFKRHDIEVACFGEVSGK